MITLDDRLTPQEQMARLAEHNKRTVGYDRVPVTTTEITKLFDFVPFKDPEQKKQAHNAAYILTNHYGKRGWVISTKHRLIIIKLWELYKLGGGNIGMVINQDDWDNETERDALILEKGGELLERANMLRTWNKPEFEIVTRLPDGFEEHMPKVKYKTLDSVAKVEDAVKQHIKEQQSLETASDFRHADDPV